MTSNTFSLPGSLQNPEREGVRPLMLTVFVNSIFRACTVPVQPDGAEPVIAESGDSAEDAVSTKLHRNAGDKGGAEDGAGN